MNEEYWHRGLSSSDNLKSAIQNPKWAAVVALVLTFVMCGAVATAQQAKKVPRIGFLIASSPSAMAPRLETADCRPPPKSRLPAIYPASQYVEDGGLMSYGVSISDLDRRAATYVDKILKGAKPAELPVEQPMKFEFIINLKAAKQIGLTIPPNVLARADTVIK
jgi:putative tryptophan/tyrosine transport system substrate-binding protein